MLIRLRSRDGLERIEVDDNATVAALKQAIHTRLNIPIDDMHLSRDPKLLTAKSPQAFPDLADNRAGLRAAGVQHGEMVYLLYSFERQVEPSIKKGVFGDRPFGDKMTVADVIAKQTRVERQEKPHAESLSFDRATANTFQSYIQGAYQFGVKRGGILYGTVDGSKVLVDFVYEPPQQGTAETLVMERHTPEEQQVEYLAQLLGYRKVGWVLSQSTKKTGEYIMDTEEIKQMAAWQDEIGEMCVTALVTWEQNESGGQVHFEAFEVSDQCVKLCKDGWLHAHTPVDGVSRMVNPKEPDLKQPVILAGKDVDEVDNDYFLCPVPITDHEGKLMTSFPVENRLVPQGKTELREHLKKHSSKSYVERLADMHLLLWLSKQPNLDQHDLALLCDCVVHHKPVLEGYRVIIDYIAGIQ